MLYEVITVLLGKTRIGKGVRIQTGCVVENCRLDDGVWLKPYSVLTDSHVRRGAILGPFAHLRPESDIGEDARIGNFVEVKKSRIGKGSKANHLAYIGDAFVGRKANIGAGTITCNYDGLANRITSYNVCYTKLLRYRHDQRGNQRCRYAPCQRVSHDPPGA